MKKSNLNIVKIDKNKSLFNYEKKVLIKELILDLKIGYFDFEKEKSQKIKFNLDVNYEDKKPSNDKDIKSIVNYAKIVRLIKKLVKSVKEQIKDDPYLSEQISSIKNLNDLSSFTHDSKKRYSILATGPLTSLGFLAKRHPSFYKSVDELVIMGGAFSINKKLPGLFGLKGNIQTIFTQPYVENKNAEWN